MTPVLRYTGGIELGPDAGRLVDFDVESLRQLIAAERAAEPEVWLVATPGYQGQGHALRDSESVRLVAYSEAAETIYATDGCNACQHRLERGPEACTVDELRDVADRTQIPEALLHQLAAVLRERA